MKHYHPANSCAIVCGAQIIDVLDGSKTEFNPLGWRGMRLQGHRTIVPVPDGWLEQHKPVPGAYLIQDHDARTTVVPEAMFLSSYHRASPADDGEYTLWPIRTTGAEAQTARAELQQLGRPIKMPVRRFLEDDIKEFRGNWDREQRAELPTRVTKEALEAMFRSVTYEIRSDGRTTVCEITFRNGFTLRDESACAHIDNFNQQLGEQQAYKKALDLAWGYAGFLLMEDRYRAGAA